MSQPVSATNRRIEEERRTKYCGTASLRVDSLSFSHQKNLRFGDEAARNTAVLARIFREEDGLRQEDAQNHITAIINPQVLETALASCNIDGSSLMRNILPYPQLELPVGVSLECLQGHDRLAAANDVFKGSDQRWIVDLYLDDLSDDLKQMLTDDYKHQRKPCDGEIYYKIREYQGICGTANSFFEKLWYGRLTVSKSRREKFQQLLGHAEYLAAFDKFLQMPALLTDLRITVLHEIMSMQCDEPILNYLAHTWIWWFKLCEGNFDSMQRIDRHTIEMLQGKAPGASKHDRDTLLVCFRNRELFSNIPEQHRDGFWDRTLENSRVGLIPSLFTFFEDRKFLHRVSESMRYILDVNGRIGVVGALSSAFQNSANDSTMEPCTIQWSDYHFTTIPGNETTRKALGARQLWLYAFREYENLPPISRKKNLLAKSRTKFDEQVLYDFAVFALQLGFQTVKIDKILSRSIDCDIAERALDAARKPEAYEYDNKPQLITQMVNMFAAAQPVSTKPLLEQQHAAEPRLPPTRYGLPEATDHTRDKSLLFLPQMKAASAGSVMNHVSSFFVRTSVYLAFFGDFPELPELRMPEEPVLIAAHTKRIDNDHDMDLCDESLPTSPIPVRKGQDSSRPQSARMQPHEAQNFEFGSGFVGEHIELSPPSVTRADESQPSMSTELAKALGELNGLRDTVAREQVKLDVIKNQVEEEQAVLDAKKQDMQILIEKEDTLSSQVQQLGLYEQRQIDEMEKQSKQCEETRVVLEKLQRQIEDGQNRKAELNNLHQQIGDARKTLAATQDDLQRRSEEKEDRDKKRSEAENELNNLHQQISDTRKTLAATQGDLQRQIEDGQNRKAELSYLHQQIDDARKTLAATQDGLQRRSEEGENRDKKRSEAESELNNLHQQIGDARKTLAATQGDLQRQTEDGQNRKAELSYLHQQIDDARKTLAATQDGLQRRSEEGENRDKKRSEAESELNNLHQQIGDARKTLAATQGDLQRQTEDGQNRKAELSYLHQQIDDARKTLAATQDSLQRRSEEEENQDKKRSEAKSELNNLHQQIGDARKTLAATQDSLQRRSEEEENQDKKRSEAKSELNNLHQQIGDARKTLAATQDGLQRRSKEEENRDKKRSEAKSKLNNLHQQIGDTRKTLAATQDGLQCRSKEEENRDKKRSEAESELNNSQQQIDDARLVATQEELQRAESASSRVGEQNGSKQQIDDQSKKLPRLRNERNNKIRLASQREQPLLPEEKASSPEAEDSGGGLSERDLAHWRKYLDEQHAEMEDPHIFFAYADHPKRFDKYPVKDGKERLKTRAKGYERKSYLLYDLNGKVLRPGQLFEDSEDKACSVLLKRASKHIGNQESDFSTERDKREIKKPRTKINRSRQDD